MRNYIPHLVWYHRGEQRIVEYGSSFWAILAAGTRRSIADTIFDLNQSHLGRDAVTVFEALEALDDDGVRELTCYRGPVPHRATLPGIKRVAYGLSRFFFYNLFESDARARRWPCGPRARHGRRTRRGRGAVARHPGRLRLLRLLPVRLRLRLPRDRPGRGDAGAGARRRRNRRADAAGGRRVPRPLRPRPLLRPRAVRRSARDGARALYADTPNVVVTASNRAGMAALPGCPSTRGRLLSDSTARTESRSRCSARTASRRPPRARGAALRADGGGRLGVARRRRPARLPRRPRAGVGRAE